MLPRWQVLVERWAISMSQVGKRSRLEAVEEVAHVGVLAVDALLERLGFELDLAERAIAVDELDAVREDDLVRDDLDSRPGRASGCRRCRRRGCRSRGR